MNIFIYFSFNVKDEETIELNNISKDLNYLCVTVVMNLGGVTIIVWTIWTACPFWDK